MAAWGRRGGRTRRRGSHRGPGRRPADTSKAMRYEPGTDAIGLYGKMINGDFIGFTGFDALSLTTDEGGTILDLSAHGGGRVRLTGIASADLSADDFVFER